jgi:hypothetical protein
LFPNPGRGAIQLQFEMLEKQNIEVKLFDMQGREVAGLYEGMLQQGAVKLTFNLNNMNLQSGQYILQLRAGGRFVDTKLVYYQ